MWDRDCHKVPTWTLRVCDSTLLPFARPPIRPTWHIHTKITNAWRFPRSTDEKYVLAAMLTTHNSPIVAIDFSTDGRYVRSTCQV